MKKNTKQQFEDVFSGEFKLSKSNELIKELKYTGIYGTKEIMLRCLIINYDFKKKIYQYKFKKY